MKLSYPNVIFKPQALGLAQTPAKHSTTEGVLRNKCPAQMELLWGNLAVLLDLCNQLNGSPGSNLSAAQEHTGRAWPRTLRLCAGLAPSATTSSTLASYGPGRAGQSHRRAANPWQSWGFVPNRILFQPLALGSQTAPHSTLGKVSEDSTREQGPEKSLCHGWPS